MSLQKLRDLDKYGVITDVDPFDLPLGAWSMAVNVRFDNGRVQSAPVWRSVTPLARSNPRYLFSANRSADHPVFVGGLDGIVTQWTPTGETTIQPTDYAASSAEATWSSCTLAEVVYVNREDRTPWGMRPSDSRFSVITGWDATWRARLIRAYNSAIIAFNITKGSVRYPTMVKTSDLVTDPGAMPPSWDATVTTNNATENILSEMNGEIVDAAPLGNSMVLYSNFESWLMTADGSSNVYSYRKLPFSAGVINTNCVAEVDGLHYVFGSEDIWAHDGQSPISISNGRVRKFIYRNMNASQADRFFVSYNDSLKELHFHFVSNDPYIKFNGNGCNRIAVYNIAKKTWTFDDAPLVFASTYVQVSLDSLTWSNVTTTWATVGGSWADLEDGFKRTMLYVGEDNSPSGLSLSMYSRDLYGNDGSLSSPVDPIASCDALLLREGIDLDELGADLPGYKHILSIYPQGRLDPSSAPLSFSFGVTDYPNMPAEYSDPQTYNALEDYKCDFSDGGRFLSLRMDYPDYKTMSLSGLDFDIEVTGER